MKLPPISLEDYGAESEARRRMAKGLPPAIKLVPILPIEFMARGMLDQSAAPPGQPERAQPEALDAIRKHEKPPRTRGGANASTQFIRDTLRMHGGASLETAYQAVIAAIREDIGGARMVFFDEGEDGFLCRQYDGRPDKVMHRDLRRRVKRLWEPEQPKRAA